MNQMNFVFRLLCSFPKIFHYKYANIPKSKKKIQITNTSGTKHFGSELLKLYFYFHIVKSKAEYDV
jgi:hypothetical protein